MRVAVSIRRLANRFLGKEGLKGVEDGGAEEFKTLAVSKGAVKVLGRVITLTATAKRRYQRWQGLGKRYNPQRIYLRIHPRWNDDQLPAGGYERYLLDDDEWMWFDLEISGLSRSTRASSWRGRGENEEREREREGAKPRRKHIHALVELVIPEVLEPKGLVSCNCINRGDILGSGVFAPATAR